MAFGIYSFYRAFSPRFREERFQLFLNLFTPGDRTSILDVGGHSSYWQHVPISSQITILNLTPTDPTLKYPERFTYRMGDGRNLPFPDQSFDIVHSNSVIEHLRTYDDQQRFAREALRVGRNVFVQTPNRWFPIEPHLITPFFHYLPKKFQRFFLPWLSLRGLFRAGDNLELKELFEEVRLLSHSEVKRLFPTCSIHRERLFGLTKSFMVVRKSTQNNTNVAKSEMQKLDCIYS